LHQLNGDADRFKNTRIVGCRSVAGKRGGKSGDVLRGDPLRRLRRDNAGAINAP
jgi:hypothetical protein